MVFDLLLVLVGMAIVVLAADRMVTASATLASGWGVSPIVVGAVVIGFGSSMPELLVSVLALDQPNGLDLAVGNAIGSNIANISLVLAVGVILYPFSGQGRVLRREGALMAASFLLSSFFLWDGRLDLSEGVALLAGLGGAGFLVVSWSRHPLRDDQTEPPDLELPISTPRTAVVALVALLFLLGGARAMVVGAEGLAQSFGISEGLTGLTILALGTSLPELAAVVASGRRGRNDLVLGNILGSNVFNALAVVGAAGAAGSGSLAADFRPDLMVMVALAIIAGVLTWSGDRLGRAEGVLLLVGYPVAIVLAL